ncbi:COPT2 protein, partial [Sula dactylatra]|nr:COPT2 protein [Sula dactylatra]
MTFYFSDTAVLLFDFWSVHTPTGLPVPLGHLVMAQLPILFYTLFFFLIIVPASYFNSTFLWRCWGGEDAGCPSPSLMGFPVFFYRWFRYHVGQTLFHVVQVVLGYMVMLAVMSYNAWIFLGAIAGSTLGYFVVYPLL